MKSPTSTAKLAAAIRAEIEALEKPIVPHIRAIRVKYSRRLKGSDGAYVLDVARKLYEMPEHSWVALELIRYHEGALSLIDEKLLREFGRRLESWGTVDAFAGFLAGPAWLRGQISNDLVASWTQSDDRWWRRAALVCTVVLNTPNAGGPGDVPRTLAICKRLLDDRDDMVVKAMSWALRKLVAVDPDTLQSFMAQHENRLAPRAKREVTNKLNTGLKNPKPASRRH